MFLLLMTSASDVLASDDVSSGALLQTQSSRRFKLQINYFGLELVQSESLRIVL